MAWLLFPLVLMAVCVGCGLLLERVGGWILPGSLLPSLGLATVIAVSTLTTQWAALAPATTPVIVALALIGFVVAWGRLRALRLDMWTLSVGVGIFAVCAAPVVVSGNATFLGYFVDGDTAFHFALIDQLLAHGRGLDEVPRMASAYSNLLTGYIRTGYPTGADVAAGAVRPLVGQDIAWVFQPYLATVTALGGVVLHALITPYVRSRALRAACAFVAGQGGLLYAAYLEASVKEITTAWIVSLTVVLVYYTIREFRVRAWVPLAVAVVGALDVLDLAALPWLGVPLAVFAVAMASRTYRSWRSLARARLAVAGVAGLGVIAALLVPVASNASTFFQTATGVLTRQGDLGNLAGPLVKWEILGIWPSGDFRLPVTAHYRIAYSLMGIALLALLLGAVWMVRRRAVGPLLLMVGNAIAAAYLLDRASPYAASKVMMILCSTAVLAAMLGAVALAAAGRRVEGWTLATLLAGGVLWTNALAYHEASVAPRARFAELAMIGSRFSGDGPAFYNLWDTFPVHFVRAEAPTIPNTWDGPPVLRSGLPQRTPGQSRLPWDPDDLALPYVESFRLLVLGRSPRTSRPPSNFRLVYEGRYFQVWRRTNIPHVLEHIALGGGLYPGAVPSCRLVLGTAAHASREHAHLAYEDAQPDPALVPSQASRPQSWTPTTANGEGDPLIVMVPQQPGSLDGAVHIATPGDYRVWLEGSLSQQTVVRIAGRSVGSITNDLGPAGQFTQLASIRLGPGSYPVVISRPSVGAVPGAVPAGSDGTGQLLGPLMLVRDADPPAVSAIQPARARSLCGRWLDWLEVVR